MKHLVNLVLGLPSPDQTQREETSTDLPVQRPQADSHPAHSRQDFTHLVAQYKRAGYEAYAHWAQTQHEGK